MDRKRKSEQENLNKRIRVDFKRTVQTRPYESASISYSVEQDVPAGEDHIEQLDLLYKEIKNEVEYKCKEILEED